MTIRAEAAEMLRREFKDGATAGRLVQLLANLYRCRGVPLAAPELISCFEEAFDLRIGFGTHELVAYFRGGLVGLTVGNATATSFPEIFQNREKWDSVVPRQDGGCWLDTLPIPRPPDPDAFRHPQIPEWDELSQASQKYIVRLALSGALSSHALHLVACLAERLQEKLAAATKQ
jgi:hypothetical protein